jgi:hypothetical protein
LILTYPVYSNAQKEIGRYRKGVFFTELERRWGKIDYKDCFCSQKLVGVD